MSGRALEKIMVVVTVAVLGVALAVGVRGTPALLLMVAVVATVSAGMDLVLRGEARYRPTPDLFILPGALVVGTGIFLPLLSSGVAVVFGLAIFAGLLFAVLWAEHSIRVGWVDRRAGELALTVIGYIAAFALYAAIYQSKSRSLISAPAIILVTFALAARQLRLGWAQSKDVTLSQVYPTIGGPQKPAGGEATIGPRRLLYAGLAALAAGEVTWALNYWPLNGLFGGAFLLACFYFLVGIFSHHLQGRLTARLVAEYGTVAAAGTLLIAIAGLLRHGA